MEPERKIVKIRSSNVDHENSDKIKKDLEKALVEHEKVKKLVDYFVLGLMLAVILYAIS
jgi:uncharacterized membrane protein YgaE (UPF0421/DUF939 family)